MKFSVTMKDPDGVFDCVQEAVKAEVAKIEGINADERGALEEHRIEEVQAAMKKWFEYDEYLRVEVDTDAQTCTVLPNK